MMDVFDLKRDAPALLGILLEIGRSEMPKLPRRDLIGLGMQVLIRRRKAKFIYRIGGSDLTPFERRHVAVTALPLDIEGLKTIKDSTIKKNYLRYVAEMKRIYGDAVNAL